MVECTSIFLDRLEISRGLSLNAFYRHQQIAETVSRPSEQDFKERGAFSQLEISILEVEPYRMGLTFTSSNLHKVYQESYVYSKETDKEDQEILR